MPEYLHFRYDVLKLRSVSAKRTYFGILFQITGPEYVNDFRKKSILGLGTLSSLFSPDLNEWDWFISEAHICWTNVIEIFVNNNCFFIIYSVNVIHFSSKNSSWDGASNDSSKVILAALFWNFKNTFKSSLLQLPHIHVVQQ